MPEREVTAERNGAAGAPVVNDSESHVMGIIRSCLCGGAVRDSCLRLRSMGEDGAETGALKPLWYCLREPWSQERPWRWPWR